MLTKESLQEQLQQLNQTIEGTESALKGMRSYKSVLETGIKNYELAENMVNAPIDLINSFSAYWLKT